MTKRDHWKTLSVVIVIPTPLLAFLHIEPQKRQKSTTDLSHALGLPKVPKFSAPLGPESPLDTTPRFMDAYEQGSTEGNYALKLISATFNPTKP